MAEPITSKKQVDLCPTSLSPLESLPDDLLHKVLSYCSDLTPLSGNNAVLNLSACSKNLNASIREPRSKDQSIFDTIEELQIPFSSVVNIGSYLKAEDCRHLRLASNLPNTQSPELLKHLAFAPSKELVASVVVEPGQKFPENVLGRHTIRLPARATDAELVSLEAQGYLRRFRRVDLIRCSRLSPETVTDLWIKNYRNIGQPMMMYCNLSDEADRAFHRNILHHVLGFGVTVMMVNAVMLKQFLDVFLDIRRGEQIFPSLHKNAMDMVCYGSIVFLVGTYNSGPIGEAVATITHRMMEGLLDPVWAWWNSYA